MVDEHYPPEPGEPWADEQLLPAEKLLLAAAKVGGEAQISTLNPTYLVPWIWGEKLQIRAELIRHLLVHPDVYLLDPTGFDIEGAYVTGTLNLANLKVDLMIVFDRCLFDNAPELHYAHTRTLAFHTCRLPGLNADGLRVEGTLFLQQSECAGEVRLLIAEVNGYVECRGATFTNKGDYAFNAEGISVAGNLSLVGATFIGGMRLLDADVTGNVNCREATFTHNGKVAFNADRVSVEGNLILDGVTITGATRMVGANINDSLVCLNATFNNAKGYALIAQRMCVKAGWIWVLSASLKGSLDLTQASVGDFLDNGSGWPEKGKLAIDGFRYDNLIFPTTAKQRINWLKLMPQIGADQKPIFLPQPYEQLIKVFKTAGHERDAREIAIAKQDAYRTYLKHQAEFNNVTTWHRRLWLLFLKYSAGYGYETWRAGWFVLIFVAFAWMVFNSAYHEGHMAPAKERIYTQSCYTKGVECDKWHTGIKLKWTDQTLNLPEDYPQFTPLTYAVDTLIPFVDLHQESYWLPTHLGYKIYLWLHIIVGWVLATIAVAGFTGLIKKD